MKIAICSDSSLDLSDDLIKNNNIIVIPFNISLGDNQYSDGIDIHSQDIFDYFKKTKNLPKTSAINSETYKNFFSDILKEYDSLIFFSISSGFSSSFNNALLASYEFEDKVKVVDSMNLSSGVGIQVLYACKLRDEGLDLNNIYDKVLERRNNVTVSFVIEKLDFLYKGGRCNSLQLLGSNLLKIKPSIIVENGKMTVHKKYRGSMDKVVNDYIKYSLNEYNTPDTDTCFVTYSSATDEMLEVVKNSLSKYGKFKNIYYTKTGSTVTSHCGRNTLGLIYYNDGKEKFEF